MDEKTRVVAVVGSPRSDGNAAHLVRVALERLAAYGAECRTIVLTEHRIMPCDGHDDCGDLARCPHDDDVEGLLETVYDADGLILASPSYYENVSGQMKLFIDRNCFNNYHEVWLRAACVGYVAVAESTGLDDTVAALRRYVALSSKGGVRELELTGFAYRAGDAAGDEELCARARRFGDDLADALGLARQAGG